MPGNPEPAARARRADSPFAVLLSAPNVLMIALPDAADADQVYADYSRSDGELTDLYRQAGLIRPDTRMRAEITYPELRIDRVPDNVRILLTSIQTERGIAIRTEDALYSKIRRIYVAWRGVVRYYQQVSGIDYCTLDAVENMDEAQAARMQVGAGPFPRFGVFPDPDGGRLVRWFY
jgi:hypothetical protein